MFTTDIYLDQVPSHQVLADAFGAAFEISTERIAVVPGEDIRAVSASWDKPGNLMLVRTSLQPGEFPLVVELSLRDVKPQDFINRLETAARILGSSMLTDECLVDPYSDAEYLLVGADGRSELVFVDTGDWDSENPTFRLVPASQIIHRSHANSQLQRAD